MQKTCKACSTAFEVFDEDLAFYDKVSPVFGGKKYLIPPPTHCSLCRHQRRMAFRNQVYVYSIPSHTGEKIFSQWTEDAPFPVMKNEEWYGGTWDATAYGHDIDFGRSFLDQFKEICDRVPQPARSCMQGVNSDYCNNYTGLKNCYLVFNASYAEDCLYCENAWGAKDCMDCTRVPYSELCYDCVACGKCYNVQSSFSCHDCSDSAFLINCRGCRSCFGCANLRRGQYCIFNEQKTKEEYEKRLAELDLSSFR